VLTTRGRRTGLARSVLLQYFPDSTDRIVVAANSGRPTYPAWYHNLTATPEATVEVDGHTLRVRAVELTDAETKHWWPHVVAIAPSYAKIPERTTRAIPLIRLVPTV
jgi:deazaflavin-dependent oxidoreductase (nitroreductase family)